MQVQFDPVLAQAVQDIEEHLRAAQRLFSLDTLERSGLAVGQLMRNPNTGATYRVETAHAYTTKPGDLPRVIVQGRREYTTGRKSATTTSYLSLSQLVKVAG